MIRRAIGLGLLILVLQFLMPKVLSSVEEVITSLFGTVNRLAKDFPGALPALVLPKVPTR